MRIDGEVASQRHDRVCSRLAYSEVTMMLRNLLVVIMV